jgi:hypothetical protein
MWLSKHLIQIKLSMGELDMLHMTGIERHLYISEVNKAGPQSLHTMNPLSRTCHLFSLVAFVSVVTHPIPSSCNPSSCHKVLNNEPALQPVEDNVIIMWLSYDTLLANTGQDRLHEMHKTDTG